MYVDIIQIYKVRYIYITSDISTSTWMYSFFVNKAMNNSVEQLKPASEILCNRKTVQDSCVCLFLPKKESVCKFLTDWKSRYNIKGVSSSARR